MSVNAQRPPHDSQSFEIDPYFEENRQLRKECQALRAQVRLLKEEKGTFERILREQQELMGQEQRLFEAQTRSDKERIRLLE